MGVAHSLKREIHYGREVLVYPGRPTRLEQIFDDTASRFSDKEALVELGGPRLTYAETLELSKSMASWLHQRGVRPGDRIALALGNTIWFPLWALAGLRVGAVILPLNLRLAQDEIAFILQDSTPKLVVVAEEASHLLPVLGSYPKVDATEVPKVSKGKFRSWGTFSEDEAAFLIYTSGTTGRLKGVILTHFNIIHSLLHYREVFGTRSEEKTLIAVPLFHVTGLIGQLWHMFLLGGTSVLLSRYQTDIFLEAMEREEISFTFAVPTIYAFLLTKGLANRSLSSWRLAAYGGAPMPLAILRELQETFPKLDLRNAYGATETASPATLMPVSFTGRKPLSVGRPVPAGEIRIADPGPDGVGEILIKGPMVTPGYYQRLEENRRSFTEEGYWRSGDLGYLDPEGFLFVVDRLKEMINRAGEKIYSQEVENVLYQHPGVLEVAVVGIPDQVYGERIKAVVVPRPGYVLTPDELLRFAAERLASFKVPEVVEFREALPRNAGGKVLKSLLRVEAK